MCGTLARLFSARVVINALGCAVHMEEIKVRHGAKARNGALVLICCVSVVTFRGHRILALKKGSGKICGAC